MKSLLLSLCLLPCLAFAADEEDWAQTSGEKFESGERTFNAARRELLENYVRDGLTEDDLYRAAVQGMLAAIDPPMRKYNRLMGPSQFADLAAELKGEVVGIGVRFKLDGGRAEIIGIVPGSPAAAADLREGDLILAVDGAALKSKSMADVVTLIRGKAGEKVRLQLLRDTALVERTLTRAKVTYELVSDTVLPGDVGLLTLRGFAESTPAQVKAALERMQKAGVKTLVVDLRGNEGGLLEKAIDVAKLMLPPGRTVAKLVERGGKERALVADGTPVLPVPTVVLTCERTASSAELLAAALREQLKAPIIGSRTRGKWSVQVIHELPNKYVMKYTVAHFKDASGKGWEGEGLAPDIEVPMSDAAFEKAERTKGVDRLSADVQLKAAVNFVRMR